MGFNHQAAGFDTVAGFVAAMQQSEGDQLQAFAAFILADKKSLVALQNQDWPAFAARYNGAAYQKNNYDDKLKNAFAYFGGVAKKVA